MPKSGRGHDSARHDVGKVVMRSRTLRGAALSAVLLAGTLHTPAAAASATAAGCAWKMSAQLPLPPGTTSGMVWATDNQGSYSGTAWGADGKRRVLTWKNGTFIDYGTGTARTRVKGQNRAGTVIGFNSGGWIVPTGEGWRTRNGRMEPLPKPPGTFESYPIAIEDDGDVFGQISVTADDGAVRRSFVRWPGDRPDTFEILPLTLPKDAVLAGIDDDGTILLNFNGRQGTYAVGLWRDGVVTYLPKVPGATHTIVRAISNGRVVGDTTHRDSAGLYHTDGVLWDQDGTVHVLADTSSAGQINRNGLVGADSDGRANHDFFHHVWRLGTLDFTFPDPDDRVTVLADDDTIATTHPVPGTTDVRPAIWHCVR
ncbi:hypothetical protein PS9374_02565 [Planomonospora sphaerica]|uniref:Uncharacterized protein n=2 Tax=Planomonospora sphaerica TaxID=161355 RepID=A0A161MAU4_9ACTN|nr:hypothetical protein PS9374_02565 [Planomonospora sphaerica]